MNFNYQKARELMVKNQLEPNKIKDPIVLNLFKKIPKEYFLPKDIETNLYSDSDITLGIKRGYLKNLHIAQLINYSEIKKKHKILHIGALTGYVTSLLANLCLEVFAIETDRKLILELKKNIDKFDLKNIKIIDGTFEKGCASKGPFDRIIIDSPVAKLDNEIIDQLNDNSGKIIMIKKEGNNLSKAIKITKNKKKLYNEYLFDVFSKYELFKKKEGFKF